MKPLLLAALAVFFSASVSAQDVGTAGLNPRTAAALRPIVKVANETFLRMPQVQLTSRLSDLCEGDEHSDRLTRYCTDLNTIYVSADLTDRLPEPAIAYLLAHQYGHAVQVRHGIADVALAKITTDRTREGELRAMVTGQVECISGVLFGRAGLRGKPSDWFGEEPFTGAHWGRSPMRNGPKVSIGMGQRDQWFTTGARSQSFEACTVGEMDTRLILRAER